MVPTYLDSSALVKLIVEEEHTDPLRTYVREQDDDFVSSAVAIVEVLRAVSGLTPAIVTSARSLLQDLALMDVEESVLYRGAELEPSTVRSLDAIHLASALALGGDLSEVVTYDEKMTEGAQQLGLKVRAPK